VKHVVCESCEVSEVMRFGEKYTTDKGIFNCKAVLDLELSHNLEGLPLPRMI